MICFYENSIKVKPNRTNVNFKSILTNKLYSLEPPYLHSYLWTCKGRVGYKLPPPPRNTTTDRKITGLDIVWSESITQLLELSGNRCFIKPMLVLWVTHSLILTSDGKIIGWNSILLDKNLFTNDRTLKFLPLANIRFLQIISNFTWIYLLQ